MLVHPNSSEKVDKPIVAIEEKQRIIKAAGVLFANRRAEVQLVGTMEVLPKHNGVSVSRRADGRIGVIIDPTDVKPMETDKHDKGTKKPLAPDPEYNVLLGPDDTDTPLIMQPPHRLVDEAMASSHNVYLADRYLRTSEDFTAILGNVAVHVEKLID